MTRETSPKFDTRVTQAGQRAVLPKVTGVECLVQIYGADLGRKFPIDARVTIGRGEECDIVLEADSVSRRHVEIQRAGGGVRISDLGSTNGTYVNDDPVESVELRHGDLVKVGDTIFKYLAAGNIEQAYHEEIYRMTIVDGLTGAYNRRYVQEYLEREVARARRYDRALAFVLFDLDHFKGINDHHGHLAGDHVLHEVAALVRGRIRREEVFGRYGGEEFCAVLPETPLEGAVAFAEQIRGSVEAHRMEFDGAVMNVTLSAGVAALRADLDGWVGLVDAADACLYKAKKSGRNKVVGCDGG